MQKLAISGILNQPGLLAVIIEKKGGHFFQELNSFLSHAGFMHSHVGVRVQHGREEWKKPASHVDQFHYLTHNARDEHQALVISGKSHLFVIFTPATREVRKKVLGAVQLYCRFKPRKGHFSR